MIDFNAPSDVNLMLYAKTDELEAFESVIIRARRISESCKRIKQAGSPLAETGWKPILRCAFATFGVAFIRPEQPVL